MGINQPINHHHQVPNNTDRTKGVIVLGMHRSGTSLFGNMLHRWGAYCGGEDNLYEANICNQRGYWEYIPMVGFNQEMLWSLSADWFIPPDREGHNVLETLHSVPRYRREAQQLINAMRQNNTHWMWKDPRLGILLPFWQKIWGDVIYIIVIRHPSEIASSLKKRDHFPLSASLLLWQLYMLAILKNTESSTAKIFVRYDDYIHHSVEYCRRLSSFLSRFCEMPGNEDQVVEEMVKAIDPNLRHNQSDIQFTDLHQGTPEQKALYSFLLEKAETGCAVFDESRFTPYTGWREYLQTLDTLTSLLVQVHRKRFILRSNIEIKHKDIFGIEL